MVRGLQNAGALKWILLAERPSRQELCCYAHRSGRNEEVQGCLVGLQRLPQAKQDPLDSSREARGAGQTEAGRDQAQGAFEQEGEAGRKEGPSWFRKFQVIVGFYSNFKQIFLSLLNTHSPA